MTEAAEAVIKMRKANKLVRLSFRKNGPKSFKHGQGALLNALLKNDGCTQSELTVALGATRAALKDTVKKAARNGYVTIEKAEGKKTYAVKLTEEGKKLAEKHAAAQDKAAEEVMACLTAEELAQFNALNEKIILAAKERGVCAKRKGHLTKRHKKHGAGKGGMKAHSKKCCKRH